MAYSKPKTFLENYLNLFVYMLISGFCFISKYIDSSTFLIASDS